MRGAAATSVGTWGGQLISWISTFYVARILTPGDYGIVAMGSVFVGLVGLLNEFGIGSGIVRFQKLTPAVVSGVAGLSLIFGFLGGLVVVAGAWPVAQFYRTPELVPVLATQGLSLFVSSIRTVPLGLLRRDLQFRAAAANDFWAVASLSVLMIVFALLGFGYWSLVLGGLFSAVVSTVLAYRLRPVRPAWPAVEGVREVVELGGHIVVQRLLWYGYNNADFLVAGRVFGKVATGAYSFGWNLVTGPVSKITALVPKVATPVFAAHQGDPEGLRRFFRLATEGLSLLSFPAAAGLALVSRDLVIGLLGDKWEAAIAPMQALAVLAAVRGVSPIFPPLLNMTGHQRAVTQNGVLSVIVMPLGFILGSRWGLAGIAWAWAVCFPLVTTNLLVRSLRAIEMSGAQYLAVLRPAVVSTAVMIALVLLAQRGMAGVHPVARLVGAIAVGALGYAATLLLVFRSRVDAIVRGLRGALGNRRPEPAT
ncbi:MAG: lipopolysaccharide biosynthesis protein [Gemmatimonadales bacterium]